jgi:hypothetical protein
MHSETETTQIFWATKVTAEDHESIIPHMVWITRLTTELLLKPFRKRLRETRLYTVSVDLVPSQKYQINMGSRFNCYKARKRMFMLMKYIGMFTSTTLKC